MYYLATLCIELLHFDGTIFPSFLFSTILHQSPDMILQFCAPNMWLRDVWLRLCRLFCNLNMVQFPLHHHSTMYYTETE